MEHGPEVMLNLSSLQQMYIYVNSKKLSEYATLSVSRVVYIGEDLPWEAASHVLSWFKHTCHAS